MPTSSIHAKHYFEKIEHIAVAHFHDYGSSKKDAKLFLLVLTNTKTGWGAAPQQVKDHIPMRRYGEKLEDWQPYENEKVEQLLQDFHTKSGIPLEVYYFSEELLMQHGEESFEEISGIIEEFTAQFTLIADAFSAYPASAGFCEILGHFNNTTKENSRGCLFPLCDTYSDKVRNFAQAQVKKTFKHLHKAWHEKFHKAYTHVELDIPNKTHFFRRLANIAYLKGISERDQMPKLESTSISKQAKKASNLNDL